MRIRTIAFTSAAVILGAIFVGRSLLAEGTRQPSQGIPQGFRGQFLFIETMNGAFTVLQNPQLRTLNNRSYVVGSTVSLEGVTDDELFKPTAQWVCLEEVRRMGEVYNSGALSDIREIAARRRELREKQAKEDEFARSRQ